MYIFAVSTDSFMTLKYLPLIAFTALMISCSSTTDLTDSNLFEEHKTGAISKVLVVGVSDNESVRNRFERQMSEQIERYGVTTSRSLQHMPASEPINRDSYVKYFSQENFDAVVVCRVIDHEKVGVYSAGDDYRQPDDLRSTDYNFYDLTYHAAAEPGHYNFAEILRIETEVLDVGSEEMIWQCHSKSFHKDNAEKLIADLTKMVGKAMKEDGVF